jgi:hypothetical protein
MALPPNLNEEKLSKAALAILGLTAFHDHHVVRAWKGMDWDLLGTHRGPQTLERLDAALTTFLQEVRLVA